MRISRFGTAAFAGLLALLTLPALAGEAAWGALRQGGAVALIRHARAPGTGDPAGFRLEDCATQRNLSEDGRFEARALGERLRAERVQVAEVRSSRWCRALDTARLAFPALTIVTDPGLDSSFDDQRGARDGRTAALRTMVEGWRGRPDTLALVTHQVNVTALTGAFLAEGDIVVLRPKPDGGFSLIGTIKP